MSRFSEYYGDEDYNNQGEFWMKRAQLALEGKRGRKALAELREALLALPEKRLISRALCTVGGEQRVEAAVSEISPLPVGDGPMAGFYRERHARDRAELEALVQEQGAGVCAIGAYVWWQKVKGGMAPDEAFAALPTIADVEGSGDYETANIGKEHGLTYTLAWELASLNDNTYEDLTPERRYTEFLGWIDQQLAKPPLRRPAPKERRVKNRAAAVASARVASNVAAGQIELPL